MKEKTKNVFIVIFIIFLIAATIYFKSIAEEEEERNIYYGFIRSEYGISVECIAYYDFLDGEDEESIFIESFDTRYGRVELWEYIYLEENKESFESFNHFDIYNTTFTFEKVREATDSDIKRITSYRNTKDRFLYTKEDMTVHDHNHSNYKENDIIYFSDIDIAALLYLDQCEICFDEDYY